ncbi:MAG: hypothetical protein IJ187_07040 [Neisseriaceae bacterium]|nr:hypothetical protein [Neisseriaceae bacterium]
MKLLVSYGDFCLLLSLMNFLSKSRTSGYAVPCGILDFATKFIFLGGKQKSPKLITAQISMLVLADAYARRNLRFDDFVIFYKLRS